MQMFAKLLVVPRNCGAGKLTATAALCFALAAATVSPAFNPGLGIPASATLRTASGPLLSADAQRNGVIIRLAGRPEAFEYPVKSGANAFVESSLQAAGHAQVTLLYDADDPRTPPLDEIAYYAVWHVSIDGKMVRSFAQSCDGWRANNAWARWIFAVSLFSAVHFAALALRARRLQAFR